MSDAALPGRQEINGAVYWINAEGGFIPDGAVKPVDKLQDEMVRGVVAAALKLSALVAAFREDSFAAVDDFVALLEQNYSTRRGGSQGNLTLTSYDGLLKVVVQVSKMITFGAELQVAKGIVDDCLREWSAGAGDELRAIINRAFDVDQQGRISHTALLQLLRIESTDARWQTAMQAIRDSFRVIGSKRYIRIYHRPDARAQWQAISIDVATA